MPLTCESFDPIVAHADGCTCGGGGIAVTTAQQEGRVAQIVRTAVLRAIFPQARGRRAFLRAVGATTAAAALAEVFPLGAAEALAQPYLDVVRAGNPNGGQLISYPGSPWLVRKL